ncbi:unnamed protein product [Discula destructiva]
MAITALSDDTVRLLGSHTVIAAPMDLVKELLDNAIDAKATSVDILVSPNVVDKIQVRDNGHGIHPDDYDSLGRSGHTSKITSFEDLHTRGGTTLGFRGQALASANNLGTLTVTTRTVRDATAVVLKLTPGVGGVESQHPSPAPVGTVVNIARLYSRLPVREQLAVKDASKNLSKIKHLLHAYALARPQIRLLFRVLGGSNKLSFSYSSFPEAGVKEAAVQIFGINLMSQCLIETVCTTTANANAELTENDKFCIQAVLPRPNADQACVSKGPFFSVDSRPVSAQRETMKKLLAIFKYHFSKSMDSNYGEKPFRDAFICVNVKCSPGSYDPNITPSKDVVLFADESQVTDLFERLCLDVYKSQDTLDPTVTNEKRQMDQGSQIQTPPLSSDGPEFGEMVPKAQPDALQPDVPHQWPRQTQHTPFTSTSNPMQERSNRHVPRNRYASVNNFGGLAIDMSAELDMSSDEDSPQEQTASQIENLAEDSREALNPWVIAKMNAPLRQQHDVQIQDQLASIPDEEFENLPVLRPFREAPGDLDDCKEVRVAINQIGHSPKMPGDHHPFNSPTVPDPIGDYLAGPGTRPACSGAYEPIPHMKEVNPRRTLPSLRSRQNRGPEDAEPDEPVQTKLSVRGQTGRSHRSWNIGMQRHLDDIPSRNNPPFRKRRQVTAKKRHPLLTNSGHVNNHVAEWVDTNRLTDYEVDSIRRSSTQRLSHSPHPSNDMTTAGNIGKQRGPAMTASSGIRNSETWVDGDSRKFLMRRQRSEAEHRRRGRPTLKRIKTDKLPLETVPESQGLQGLVLTVEPDTDKLAQLLDGTVGGDTSYDAFHTEIELSDQMGLEDATEVETRLKDMFSVWTEMVLGKRTEVSIDLRTRIKGKGLAF